MTNPIRHDVFGSALQIVPSTVLARLAITTLRLFISPRQLTVILGGGDREGGGGRGGGWGGMGMGGEGVRGRRGGPGAAEQVQQRMMQELRTHVDVRCGRLWAQTLRCIGVHAQASASEVSDEPLGRRTSRGPPRGPRPRGF